MTEKNDVVLKELEKIRKKNGGILKAIDVVEAAEKESSPLHDQFQWDDSKAAKEYRLWQARSLIKVCYSIVRDSAEPVQHYISLTPDRSEPSGGYRAVIDVLSDDDLREQMLRDAAAELSVFKRKYSLLKELASVFTKIDEFAATIEARVETPRADPVQAVALHS